jgi:hypothetical protein
MQEDKVFKWLLDISVVAQYLIENQCIYLYYKNDGD